MWGRETVLRPGPEATRRRADLQGVRALAVLLVVLNHANVGFLAGGYIGVDVFFVLSGFLITGLLLRGSEKTGSVGFIDFYSRRVRRILPSAALTLIATDIAAYHLLNVVRAKQTAIDSISAAFFTANIHFAHQGTNYFAQGQPPSPIRQFWSLAVEEQFYIVWPAVIALVVFGIVIHRRRGVPGRFRDNGVARRRPVTRNAIRRLLVVLIVLGIASFAWSIYDTNHIPAEAFFSTLTRAWELALGAGLAIAARALTRLPERPRAIMGWTGLAMILIAAVAYTGATPFPGYAALLPCLGVALIIAGGIASTQARWAPHRLLSVAPMRYVGDRSYTFYLWHWPVLVIAAQHANRTLSVGTNLLLVAAAFALSVVTYRFFENPIRHASWLTPARALLLALPLGVLLVVSVAGQERSNIEVAAVRAQTLAAPVKAFAAVKPQTVRVASSTVSAATLPEVKTAARAAQQDAPIPGSLTPPVADLLADHAIFPLNCQPSLTASTAPICHLGDTSSRKTLVVMGDSHAEMYAPAIEAMATRDHWNVVPLIKSACTPTHWEGSQGTAACRTWYHWALGRAAALKPDAMLISGAFSGEAGAPLQSTIKGLDEAATTLRGRVKHVLILGDDPRQHSQPVDCLLSSGATMSKCSVTWADAHLNASNQIQGVAESDGATFIDPTGWYCSDANVCPMVVGNTIVYADSGHITMTYAAQLAGPFRVTFEKALTTNAT
jgi:peptidoglycan/LPS O-acetylase OafA/YrhL